MREKTERLAFRCRTLIIYVVIIVLLCIVYKLQFKPDAYFSTVNYVTLFVGHFVYALQLISFCIMTAQVFDANVRAVLVTLATYYLSALLHSWALTWPPGVQYILIFFFPYIGGRSIFQVGDLFVIPFWSCSGRICSLCSNWYCSI